MEEGEKGERDGRQVMGRWHCAEGMADAMRERREMGRKAVVGARYIVQCA